jgi:hypothetical protein
LRALPRPEHQLKAQLATHFELPLSLQAADMASIEKVETLLRLSVIDT